ncbi:ribonuclease R [Hydromonas duriensis]|uniref:Ribonuclease R n=1 Tax=Hydromonas duriensis TaxID=1527608 RepID=A0A4R6Y3G9_9BURK|nr:ribonuclease R [Hydromonas duriensis]TDR31060.1 RNAse R [Hydromonas duriensis]
MKRTKKDGDTAKTTSQNNEKVKLRSTTKKRSNAKTSQTPALLKPRAEAKSKVKPTSSVVSRQKMRPTQLVALPSRSTIFNVIHAHAVLYKKPLNTIQLAQELDVSPTQVSALQEVLDQMSLAGDIKMMPKGSYAPLSDQALVSGILQTHKDGYGFVSNDSGEDVFLPERQMHGAWHGDTVTVRITGTARNGKREGEVVEVVHRKSSQVVGRLLSENGVWLVSPDDVRLRSDILVSADDLMGALVNQIVVVTLKNYGDGFSMPTGQVVEVLGNSDDAGMEIEIAVRKFDVPHVFSTATDNQVAKLADSVSPDEYKGRIDLRDVPLVTIDGEDARDFDDAVYCEPILEGKKTVGYRLLVAIADVSHYVKDKTPLNEDALTRATSVYFPRRVVPMLPEKLSNGLCSLNPHVERLCMVCDMVVDLAGDITAYQFYEAVMHSAARLTYNQVWQYLDEGTGVLAEQFPELCTHISDLYSLFKLFLDARTKRGAMEFETVETYIVADEKGKITQILPRTRNDAHRLIEECMLAANVCAAEFISTCERTCLYRVHEGPTPEKLEALRRSLKAAGLSLQGGEKPQPKDYANVMQQVHGRPDASVLQTLMLRSMQQAIYTPDNLGHFGLAFSAYTHFTSPIRRYPDLLVHRTIKAILNNQHYMPMTDKVSLLEDNRKKRDVVKTDEKNANTSKNDNIHHLWSSLGEHTSMCERRADEASRDVTAWLKCEYMKQFIGETLSGHVSSVTNFGAFVTLDDMYVDGLIHISELGQDYFEFDEVSHSLIGRASGTRYRLQDTVKVKIAAVDSDTRRVDFLLDTSAHQNNSRKRTQSKNNSPVEKNSSSTKKPRRRTRK